MKKRNLIVTIALMTAFTASSQTFSWTTNDTVQENLAFNTTVQFPMYMVAIGTDTVTLGIEVIYNDLPLYWDGMLCIYGTCLGTIPVVGTTAEMSPISGTTEGMVRLTVNPIGGSEVAKLQVYVFDVNFPNDGDTATFLLNNSLSINEMNILESELKLFPNPTNKNLTINSPTELEQVLIYTTSGLLVASYGMSNIMNSIIDVSKMSSGIYMISIEDKKGNRVNKKFIKE